MVGSSTKLSPFTPKESPSLMWTCVAYFHVAPSEAETRPYCALLKNEGRYCVVRASDTEFKQYNGTDTVRFKAIVAARPKAVFINTYVSIGDITTPATILVNGEVTLPTEDSPAAND